VVRDSRPKHFFQNIYDLCNSIMFLFKDNSSPKIKKLTVGSKHTVSYDFIWSKASEVHENEPKTKKHEIFFKNGHKCV
jgi:hypothetical protein